ncbi:CDK5 regulatory subunit-associated protein 2-like isoform X2 [Contarinia nasturtii]|uniref:CDK5 regulatory subunit-associated protein 2-like isoform X2 n=1 Tax=Contarinia nasturtii TaxID=265458 RepID=UPI0012D3A21F|nr:CDK5 regulatory subunit-associated protein 2-like isoform X2 [Contarinia nasturtii]
MSESRTCENGMQSPSKGRSLREFDEELHTLRKENFNLKLRIFFLEEKENTKNHIENSYERNIELKVENEELKKELEAKQILLCEAAKAIEEIENIQKKQKKNFTYTHEEVSELNTIDTNLKTRIYALEATIKAKENDIEERENIIETQKETLRNYEKLIAQYEMEDKARIIQDLREKLVTKTRAHEKGCKTIQLLLLKTRELDNDLKGFKRFKDEINRMCNYLKMRLHELAGFLNLLLKHGGEHDQHSNIQKAIEESLNLSKHFEEHSFSANSILKEINDKFLPLTNQAVIGSKNDKCSLILNMLHNESKSIKSFRQTIFYKFSIDLEALKNEIITKNLVPRCRIPDSVLDRTKFIKEGNCLEVMDETNNLNTPKNIKIEEHNCGMLEIENAELRTKLERTKRAFEKTWAQLRFSNQRKEQIASDIRHEIYKTHSTLIEVKKNIETKCFDSP